MKINYEFIDGTVEIDVDEEWGKVVIDLDRNEYNNNHKETRRHTSLDTGNAYSEWLECEEHKEEMEISARLSKAIGSLTVGQRDLIQHVYFEGYTLADYARHKGLHKATVTQTHQRAIKNLKNFF